MSSKRSAAYARVAIGAALWLGICGVARAQTTTKRFIDYFRPTPITCPLTTKAWGCTATGSTAPNCSTGIGVVPRDTCNGIESSTNPPGSYYWDGTIVLAPDGTYHLFADRWAGSSGFNPGWEGSDPIHAVGAANPLGPYTDKGFAYSDGSFGGDSHHGHNSEVVSLLNGTYAMVVSEVVPFTVFTASSLDGPWTPCSGSPGAGLSVPSGFGGNTSYGSNVSLVVRPDGNFEIIQRHGLIALSTGGICGPYKAQQPTNSYPASEAIPAQYSASIYPNRQKHLDSMAPSTVESTYTLAEDPVIWFSGGQYHVLYDYPGDRVGYYLSSSDGIHNWTDEGLAYDPRYAQQIFSYTDGTVDHWFKMERPSVLVENGHVTHLTFAVSDVDKNNQISAGTDHGSKVIVVPFDGVALDSDTGVGGALGGMGGTSGAGGKSGMGGTGGTSGASAGTGGRPTGAGGSTTSGTGGVGTGGGTVGTGGAATGGNGAGGLANGNGGNGAGGLANGSGGNGAGGLANGSGGSGGGAKDGGPQAGTESGGSGSPGCSCTTQRSARASVDGRGFALGFFFLCLLRRRRRRAQTWGQRSYPVGKRNMFRTGVLLSIALSLCAAHAGATTNQFRGVNWADKGDNFQSGVVYVSGLSSSDTYDSALATGTSVMTQFVSKLGANAVRMPINEATVSGYWGTYTGAIDAVLSKGSVVLCYWDSGRTNKPPDINAFWKMWKTVVDKYGGNKNAYFEIFNEPNMYSTSDLISLYSSWLTQFPTVPQSRVILDGTGDAQNVPNIGSASALSGCLLAVHDYSFFGSSSWNSESQWASQFKGEVGNYADRTVCTEWGGPMSPGSKNGVSYGSLDYSQAPKNYFEAYIRGMSSQLRAWNMGSFYWAGLKDGDWYSMTTRSGTGSNLALSVPNASGLAQLQNAWTSTGAAGGGAAGGGAGSAGQTGQAGGGAGGTPQTGAGGSGGAALGGGGTGGLAGASSAGYGGSSAGAGETGGASDGIGGTTASAGGTQGSLGGSGGTALGSGAGGAGAGVGGSSSPPNAEGDSSNGCSCTTAGGNRQRAGGLACLIFAAIAARRRKRHQTRGR